MSMPRPRRANETDAEYRAVVTAAARGHDEMNKRAQADYAKNYAAASTTAKPASKSNLSVAKRAELTDAYKKNYAAATAKKPAATLAATVKAKPLTAAITKTATSATAKPATSATATLASKSRLSDAKRAELSANYKKNYAAAMAPFKDRIATKNAAKAAATVKKATGGYVTKPTFKW
jgi:hypothetical protein